VVFAAERSWEGRLSALGFVEDLVYLAPPHPPDAPEQAAVFPSREDFDTRDQLFRRLAVALHTVHFKAVGQPGIGEGLFIGFDIVQPQQTDRLAHEIRFLIALVLRFREQLKNFRA
jgi:hypothetical protein